MKVFYGHNNNNKQQKSKIFTSRALKAKKDVELKVTDCVAEVDKWSACSDEGKERFAIQIQIGHKIECRRQKGMEAGADGRAHFQERKVKPRYSNW